MQVRKLKHAVDETGPIVMRRGDEPSLARTNAFFVMLTA
jgi:hypothetical protein